MRVTKTTHAHTGSLRSYTGSKARNAHAYTAYTKGLGRDYLIIYLWSFSPERPEVPLRYCNDFYAMWGNFIAYTLKPCAAGRILRAWGWPSSNKSCSQLASPFRASGFLGRLAAPFWYRPRPLGPCKVTCCRLPRRRTGRRERGERSSGR